MKGGGRLVNGDPPYEDLRSEVGEASIVHACGMSGKGELRICTEGELRLSGLGG